jgi:hypothetical protein
MLSRVVSAVIPELKGEPKSKEGFTAEVLPNAKEKPPPKVGLAVMLRNSIEVECGLGDCHSFGCPVRVTIISEYRLITIITAITREDKAVNVSIWPLYMSEILTFDMDG